MGLLRYVLAALVVIFHLSGYTMLSGRLAVMGFYTISGYLIARVLDRSYGGSPSGLAKFAANRLLRLYPLYVVLFFVALTLFETVGTPPLHPTEDEWGVLRTVSGWSWSGLSLLPSFDTYNGVPIVRASDSLIPQSWSIEIELAFYLTAVLAAAVGLRRATPVMLTAAAGWFLYRSATISTWNDFEVFIYRDALATAIFFWAGAALYVYGDRLRVPGRWYWPALLGLLVYLHGALANRFLIQHLQSSEPGWNWTMASLNLGMLLITAVIILAARERVETEALRRLGDLSYGLYLNHFIAAALMLVVADVAGSPLFGRTGDLGFSVLGLAVASSMAWLTYRLIEHPLEQWRTAVRGTPRPALRSS